jgi:hypothetical protein
MNPRRPVNLRSLLFDGLADAAGCVAGALLGLGVGQLIGLDLPAGGFSNSSLIGIALIVLAASFGVQLARHCRTRFRDFPEVARQSGKP